MSVVVILLCIAALFALSLTAIASGRSSMARTVVYGGCAGVSLIAFATAILFGASETVLPLGLPWIGAHARVDTLARTFLALINLGGAGASVYAIGYGRHEHAPQRVLPFVPAFLAAMNLVIIANDAYTFLFAWELMSVASWALVMSDHRNPDSARAGIVYLIMAVFSALTLLLGFGLLAGTHGYDFTTMRAGHLAPWRSGLVLALALVGAGSKAGLVPLHAWLPLAHPAAPSHVSALMSGVMTKVAVYAFIRITFDLLGAPAWWWALPVLVLGGASAAMGILQALMERDLKRLLACSTIENIGIIFIGLGMAIAFRANAMPDAAALALTASLFHAFNHMLFKSTLFFGAGSVLVATGERNIERLGGLIRMMPISSAAILMASMAISALPPLNGFASEWLMFQTILVSPALPQWSLRLLVPSVGTLLALAAALTAACFVRAFGITYLGRPRSAVVGTAHEADQWSLAAIWGFTGLCLLAGLFPGVIMDALAPTVQEIVGSRLPGQGGLAWLSIVPIRDSRSSYNGLMLFLFITTTAAIVSFAVKRFASRAWRRAPLWDCGFPGLGPFSQYTAASLSQPIRRVFGPLAFHSSEKVVIPTPGDMAPASIRKVRQDLIWDALYAPIAGAIWKLADVLNYLQFLTIRRYLTFVFLVLVVLLLGLTLWQ